MMTITSATTKSELVEVLKKSTAKVRKVSTDLADRVKYATGMFAKDASKVTKKDLVSLLAEVDKALAVPASADTKKPATKESPKKEKPKASLKKKEEPKAEHLIKPTSKKGADKKEEPKKEEAKKPAPKKPTSKKEEKTSVQEALDAYRVQFPDSLTIETEDGEAEYTLAKGKFKDFKALEKYLSDEDNPSLIFAVPTTKQQAKERNYGCGLLSLPKNGFPNNIDVYIPVYIGQTNSVIALASLYTDDILSVLSTANVDDVEEVDGIRYAGSLAYQIYVEA